MSRPIRLNPRVIESSRRQPSLNAHLARGQCQRLVGNSHTNCFPSKEKQSSHRRPVFGTCGEIQPGRFWKRPGLSTVPPGGRFAPAIVVDGGRGWLLLREFAHSGCLVEDPGFDALKQGYPIGMRRPPIPPSVTELSCANANTLTASLDRQILPLPHGNSIFKKKPS